MVLNQNQVSSKHLKMTLARRYTSQVFLYLRHIHFKVRLLTESRMTARLLKSRRLDWRKESLLMMEYAGLEFTRKMVLCFPQRFNLLFNRSDFIFKIFWFVETFHLTSLAFSISFSLGSLVSLNCIGSVYINPGSHIRCYRLSSLCVEVVSTCFHLSAAVAISV